MDHLVVALINQENARIVILMSDTPPYYLVYFSYCCYLVPVCSIYFFIDILVEIFIKIAFLKYNSRIIDQEIRNSNHNASSSQIISKIEPLTEFASADTQENALVIILDVLLIALIALHGLDVVLFLFKDLGLAKFKTTFAPGCIAVMEMGV